MNLVRVGKKVINLDYLIVAEDWEDAPVSQPGPGSIRVTLETGRLIDLTGHEAVVFRQKLAEVLGESEAPDRVPETPMRSVSVATEATRPVRKRSPKR